MSRLHAIITLAADAETLADVAAFLTDADRLHVEPETPLLDGGHLRVTGYEHPVSASRPVTIADVEAWVISARGAGVPGDALLTAGGRDLAVDLAVQAVEEISCGDCGDSLDVLVLAHPCAPKE